MNFIYVLVDLSLFLGYGFTPANKYPHIVGLQFLIEMFSLSGTACITFFKSIDEDYKPRKCTK